MFFENDLLYTGSMYGKASIIIETESRPRLKACSITPTKGVAVKTLFHVDCDYDMGKSYSFEIYEVQDKSGKSGRKLF